MNTSSFHTYTWLLPFFLFVIGYGGVRILVGHTAHPMPDLVGLSAHEALGILSAHTLNPRIVGYKYDDAPPGTILSHTPHCGSMIKKHQSVFLVLAQEPKLPTMPHAIQRKLSDIQGECTTVGIAPIICRLSHSWPADTCFAQSPPAGFIVQKSKKPILYISSGRQHKVVWPSFLRMTTEAVLDILAKRGFAAEIIPSDNRVVTDRPIEEISYIIEQRPLAGSLIDITRPEQVAVQLRVT